MLISVLMQLKAVPPMPVQCAWPTSSPSHLNLSEWAVKRHFFFFFFTYSGAALNVKILLVSFLHVRGIIYRFLEVATFPFSVH